MKRLLAVLLVLSAVAPAFAGGVGAQAFAEEEASLSIEQPHYVETDVRTDTSGNGTTYAAAGDRLLITPDNFDADSVVDYGVGTEGARLTRNTNLGVYEFTTSKDGTYQVFFIVEETREVIVDENESNATNATAAEARTVRVRYAARINTSRTGLTHIDPASLEQTRADAQNWTAFAGAVKRPRVAGPDANMDEQTQLAINLLRLRYHPWAALTGNFTQVLTLLVLTLGGLIVLALALGWHAYSRYADVSELREYRDLDSERADLETQLEDLETKETLAALEGMDWNHLFPDDVARSFRDAFGETVLDGWLRLQAALEPQKLVRDRLQAMADTHVAITDDPVTRSDGGGFASAEEDVSATLYPSGEHPEVGAPRTHDLDDPDEWLVDAVDWCDKELQQFDLPGADLEHEDLDTELEAPTVEELVERFDVQLERDFDGDTEQFAQYVAEFMRSVADHDICDKQGQPRRIRLAANLFLRTSRILRDRHQFPAAEYPAQYFEMVATKYSTEEEVSRYVSAVESGRVGGD